MKRTVRLGLRIVLGLALLLLAAAAGYLIYFFAAYHRIPDRQLTEVEDTGLPAAQTGRAYTITSYNIGFGAYSADYSFFMDGGTESWAYSEQAVRDNTAGAIAAVQAAQPDFALFQEVDLDSTRSYHVDQNALLQSAFAPFCAVTTIDFDSPFLFYPFTQPHGRCYSSIVTLSSCQITESERRSLPIDQGFSKFVDLDRCFSVSAIPVAGGGVLYLYNVHLSAYSNEADTVESQVRLLAQDIESRYDGGKNYILVGGDFNQDMLGDSAEVFGTTGEYSWTKPFRADLLPEYCRVVMPDKDTAVPTCRLADAPYVAGESFVITLDSFIVSDNIAVDSLETIDTGFAWSDHNPVQMRFTLQ